MSASQLFSYAQNCFLLAGGHKRFYNASVIHLLFPSVGTACRPSPFPQRLDSAPEGVGRCGQQSACGTLTYLFVCFSFTEFLDPFQRVIQPEEIWLYKNPLVQSDNVPTRLMFVSTMISWLI